MHLSRCVNIYAGIVWADHLLYAQQIVPDVSVDEACAQEAAIEAAPVSLPCDFRSKVMRFSLLQQTKWVQLVRQLCHGGT
jgi:hypothetical protein